MRPALFLTRNFQSAGAGKVIGDCSRCGFCLSQAGEPPHNENDRRRRQPNARLLPRKVNSTEAMQRWNQTY